MMMITVIISILLLTVIVWRNNGGFRLCSLCYLLTLKQMFSSFESNKELYVLLNTHKNYVKCFGPLLPKGMRKGSEANYSF